MSQKLDLEGKTQAAVMARLTRHPDLAGVNIKPNASETPRLNGDIVVIAVRGNENPLHSGIYDEEVTIELRVKITKGAGSLATYNKMNRAIDEVLMTDWRKLSKEITSEATDFHCYEFRCTGKDDSPDDNAHASLWSCAAICMPIDFDTGLVNTP